MSCIPRTNDSKGIEETKTPKHCAISQDTRTEESELSKGPVEFKFSPFQYIRRIGLAVLCTDSRFAQVREAGVTRRWDKRCRVYPGGAKAQFAHKAARWCLFWFKRRNKNGQSWEGLSRFLHCVYQQSIGLQRNNNAEVPDCLLIDLSIRAGRVAGTMEYVFHAWPLSFGPSSCSHLTNPEAMPPSLHLSGVHACLMAVL